LPMTRPTPTMTSTRPTARKEHSGDLAGCVSGGQAGDRVGADKTACRQAASGNSSIARARRDALEYCGLEPSHQEFVSWLILMSTLRRMADRARACCGSGARSAGTLPNRTKAPWGTFAAAHNRPPCASVIERQKDLEPRSPAERTAGERPSSAADLAAPRKETPNYPPQRQTLKSHVRRQFPETETKSL
jgi:hypothetical protein